MKKLLAVLLVAVMLTVAVSAASTTWKNSDDVALSFDTIFFDDAIQKDGSAGDWIDANPITVGSVETISTRGWAGNKAEGAKIAQFGYRINNGEYVFNDAFTNEAEAGVIAAGGEYRFKIDIPVKGLTEPTLLVSAIKNTDGTIIDIIAFSVNGDYTGAGIPGADDSGSDTPATSDAAVVVIAAIAAVALAGVVVAKKVKA